MLRKSNEISKPYRLIIFLHGLIIIFHLINFVIGNFRNFNKYRYAQMTKY